MGATPSSQPVRKIADIIQKDSPYRVWSRSFASENGDSVHAVVPPLGESITDGTLATLLKKPGDTVKADEPIAQIETDKVTVDISSPEAGVIQKFLANEGDTVTPGTKVAIITKGSEGVTHVAPSEEKSDKSTHQPSLPAKKSDVQKEKVEAITSEKPKAPPPPTPKPMVSEPQLPPKDRERRVPMTRLRKRVATRLKDSQNTYAMLTTYNEVDM
ncbi:hypothetical protein QJS10_CPB22g00569 [Acorus calamus]|uniref:Lipoyl-binding domain-containing protein n=1 Tax=Acorus calamus TaxID=4465 RepID=A0AAV9C0J5_ACOCL|nr:hypothetical protein QJS10_CPB22g00569 [Acorus calamus]